MAITYPNVWTQPTVANPAVVTIAPSAGSRLFAFAVDDAGGGDPSIAGWTRLGYVTCSFDAQGLVAFIKDGVTTGAETSVSLSAGGSSIAAVLEVAGVDATAPLAGGLTTLSAAIATTSATTMSVASAASFPGSGSYDVLIDSEIITITAGQGTTTWTITRGARGTVAATHASGATVMGVITALSDNDAGQSSPATIAGTLVPSVAGAGLIAVVGTDVNASNDSTTTFSDTGALTWTTRIDINAGFRNLAVGTAVQGLAASTTVTGSSAFASGQAGMGMCVIAVRPAVAGASGDVFALHRHLNPWGINRYRSRR